MRWNYMSALNLKKLKPGLSDIASIISTISAPKWSSNLIAQLSALSTVESWCSSVLATLPRWEEGNSVVDALAKLACIRGDCILGNDILLDVRKLIRNDCNELPFISKKRRRIATVSTYMPSLKMMACNVMLKPACTLVSTVLVSGIWTCQVMPCLDKYEPICIVNFVSLYR